MDGVAGDPRPPHDAPMESRAAVLEEIATTMNGALGLAAMMAKGFHWF